MQRIKWIPYIFMLFLLWSNVTLAADPPLPTPVGRVVWIKGTLTAIMPNNERRILQKMSVIYLHDTLITDQSSQAQIVFSDETLLSFYPNTKFFIDQYAFKGKQKGSVGKYIMNLIEGGFRTITGLIAKGNPQDYQINTPVATIGVRGTDYAVYIRGKELFVGNYSGRPCVSGKEKGSLCLNDKTRYATVGLDGVPVPLSQQPSVFTEKLNIIPFKISPFGTAAAPQSGRGPSKGGVTSSFCIMQ